MQEIWKPIPGYENLYSVSNFGRVLSHSKGRSKKEFIMKTQTNYRGAHRIKLRKNGEEKFWFVHKMIQAAFDLGDGQVDHIDRDPSNNRLDNLRIVTNRINNLNRTNNARLPGAHKNKVKLKYGEKIYWTSSI